jgi:hypothetical protein
MRVDFFPSKNLAVEAMRSARARADSPAPMHVNKPVTPDVSPSGGGPARRAASTPVSSASPGPTLHVPTAPCVSPAHATPPSTTARAPPSPPPGRGPPDR